MYVLSDHYLFVFLQFCLGVGFICLLVMDGPPEYAGKLEQFLQWHEVILQ
jgi:hypothetical protein